MTLYTKCLRPLKAFISIEVDREAACRRPDHFRLRQGSSAVQWNNHIPLLCAHTDHPLKLTYKGQLVGDGVDLLLDSPLLGCLWLGIWLTLKGFLVV
jgi:hypothetical protein